MRKKTTDDNEHKQSTMRRSEYNAIIITTSDLIKQPDYNVSYNLFQNFFNLSHKSKIVEIEYFISISCWSGIQGWLLERRQDPLYRV